MTLLGLVFYQWTAIVIIVLYIGYKWHMRRYLVFLHKGIPYKKPIPFFGNFAPLALRLQNLNDFVYEYYNSFKGSRLVFYL